MIDFNQLAQDIYKNECAHKHSVLASGPITLSTFRTQVTMTRAGLVSARDFTNWNPWWDNWNCQRTIFRERFGQITADTEILIIERTLREQFDK